MGSHHWLSGSLTLSLFFVVGCSWISHARPAPTTTSGSQGGGHGHCCPNRSQGGASGQINPDGKGMKEMRALLCRTPPDQTGRYSFFVSQYRLPLGATGQQRATAFAIMSGYKVNMQLVQARASAQEARLIAQMQAQQQTLTGMHQQAIDAIQRIGAMNATEAASSAQGARFDQQENNISRQGQGFSNYLLDQSVVQNNKVGGTGMVGHATMWNSTADALVRIPIVTRS